MVLLQKKLSSLVYYFQLLAFCFKLGIRVPLEAAVTEYNQNI